MSEKLRGRHRRDPMPHPASTQAPPPPLLHPWSEWHICYNWWIYADTSFSSKAHVSLLVLYILYLDGFRMACIGGGFLYIIRYSSKLCFLKPYTFLTLIKIRKNRMNGRFGSFQTLLLAPLVNIFLRWDTVKQTFPLEVSSHQSWGWNKWRLPVSPTPSDMQIGDSEVWPNYCNNQEHRNQAMPIK